MPDLAAPYADARDRLLALTDGLSHEDFNRKPAEDAWSAGECVVHLNKIAKGYLPVFEEAVAEAGAPRGQGPFRYGFLGRKFVSMLAPGTRPMPTGGPMKPPPTDGLSSEIDPDRALETFRSDIARYLAVCQAADGLDLARIKRRSPFLPLIKFPLGIWIQAMGQHSLRHVLQAERAVHSASAA